MTEVEIDWFEGDRAELDTLFALADDSRDAVAGYRDAAGYSSRDSSARSSATHN